MNKSLYWFLKSVSYLEIAILATIGVVISVEAVTARPSCYLIDGSGRVINLSSVCVKKSPPTTENKPESKTQTTTPTPEGEKDPSAETKTPQVEGENPPENQEVEKKEEEEELDPALFSPAQRRVPVLNQQRKDTLTEE